MRLIKFVLICGLIWSAYWYAASYMLRQGVTHWFAAQEARGWQADFARLDSSGYPVEHFTTLEAPALADPRSGVAWQADWVHLVTPAIWPGRMEWQFPTTPQRLSYLDLNSVIEAHSMRAGFHLHPDLALSVARLSLTSGPWLFIGPLGEVSGGDSFHAVMEQTIEPDLYRFDLRAERFEPGTRLRRMTQLSDQLPEQFSDLSLGGSVRFDKPWDRRALEHERPQPRMLVLDAAQARWGALNLHLSGQIRIDAAGQPSGEILVQAENWRDVLALAGAAGLIPSASLPALTRVFETLSRSTGDDNTLKAPLKLGNGLISLGPIPLGPAPVIFVR